MPEAHHVLVSQRGPFDVYRINQKVVTRLLDEATRYTEAEAAFLARRSEQAMTLDEATERRAAACVPPDGVVSPDEGRDAPLEQQHEGDELDRSSVGHDCDRAG